MSKFKEGMEIIVNNSVPSNTIYKLCYEYGTNPQLIELLMKRLPLTIIDVSELGVQVKEYQDRQPWIPQTAIKIYTILEEGDEL